MKEKKENREKGYIGRMRATKKQQARTPPLTIYQVWYGHS
jgi:hypothetical protein